MNAQPTLFEAMQAPRNEREARFLAFHEANPVVYQLWDRFTREAIAKGHKRVGSQMIMERIRWETTINIIDARPDGEALLHLERRPLATAPGANQTLAPTAQGTGNNAVDSRVLRSNLGKGFFYHPIKTNPRHSALRIGQRREGMHDISQRRCLDQQHFHY